MLFQLVREYRSYPGPINAVDLRDHISGLVAWEEDVPYYHWVGVAARALRVLEGLDGSIERLPMFLDLRRLYQGMRARTDLQMLPEAIEHGANQLVDGREDDPRCNLISIAALALIIAERSN